MGGERGREGRDVLLHSGGLKQPPVLLVDDSPDDLELLERAFEEIGFSHPFLAARDGKEALDLLALGSGVPEPRLVVLDLKMPRVDGLEVLRRLRGDPALRHLPVMVLTSSDEERDRSDAFGLGVDHYIRKPVDFKGYMRLARKIRDVLAALPA